MFKNKTLNIIYSILLAVLMWSYVMIEINPQATKTFTEVEVQYLNANDLDAKGLAVYETEKTKVDVVVEGNSNVLNAMTAEDISITVDLFGREKGENFIPIKVQVPEGVRVTSSSVDNALVIIEDKVTNEKELEISIVGVLPSNYKLKSSVLEPFTIEISGAESLVDQVATVVAEVDASAVTREKITLSANVKAYNLEGKEVMGLSFSQNTVKAILEFTIEEESQNEEVASFSFTEADITISNLDENLEALLTETNIYVEVKGTKEDIDNLKKEDIILSVNLSEKVEGTYMIPIVATITKSTSEVIISPVEIHVEIKKKEGEGA